MSSSTTALEVGSTSNTRNRSPMRQPEEGSSSSNGILSATEEVLVDKLDKFLSSIEARLDNFEQFFKFTSEQEVVDSLDLQQGTPLTNLNEKQTTRSRRSSSSASLHLLKTFSMNNLNLIHQRLTLIKKSVLTNSFNNLEYLYKTLDDQYNYLFTSYEPEDEEQLIELTITKSCDNNKKEILTEKIITTIQYFDEKLLQIDDFIKTHKPAATDDYTHDAILNKLRFFNFNRALRNATTRGLIHYYELPLSWRENKYIIEGYRFSLSHKTMLRSIFEFNHNESMNIWSHIIGLMYILYLAFVHFPLTDAFGHNTTAGNVAMYVFLTAAAKCLISSSAWHTYSCFAHYPTRQTMACVDYTGITVLITCLVIVVEYCALFNHPKLLMLFIVFSSICGSTGFIFNWSPYFDKPECRSLRIGFFMGLAFLGITSAICMAFYEGVWNALTFMFPLVYKSFLWYWIGVIFYGGLIPERWRYDVIIEENNTAMCQHNYDTRDVLLDIVETSGVEEMEQIEEEFEEIVDKHPLDSDWRVKEILDKHFKKHPDRKSVV